MYLQLQYDYRAVRLPRGKGSVGARKRLQVERVVKERGAAGPQTAPRRVPPRGSKTTNSHSDYIIPLLEFCVKCFVFVTEGELER